MENPTLTITIQTEPAVTILHLAGRLDTNTETALVEIVIARLGLEEQRGKGGVFVNTGGQGSETAQGQLRFKLWHVRVEEVIAQGGKAFACARGEGVKAAGVIGEFGYH